MSQLADDLRAAKALIDTPEKWTKGIGRPGCYCAMYAVGAAIEQRHGGVRWGVCDTALRKALPARRRATVDSHPVVAFNDDPSTTHADIMALFSRAIATAEAHS